MIYIIDNTSSYITMTCYEHSETRFVELSKPYKNAIGFGFIEEEKAISIMLKEKIRKLPFNEQVAMNMKFHKGLINKKDFALQGLRKTRKKSVIDFIERNL